jgi:phage terminase large subunit
LSILRIPTARVFEPLLAPARYKAVYGGRGSGKSHFFGELLVEICQAERGTSAVCIRESQRTLAQSSKRLIESKIAALGLGHQFKIFNDKIESPGDGIIIFRGMQDHTSESIKSLEGFGIAWVDEAQNLSARSLSLLRPTIRAEGSQLWASWNPRRKSDAIDDFFRVRKPPGSIVVNANWRNNPWFPAVLEEERKLDLSLYPDRYDHIWEGDYVRAFEGAYFAQMLIEAKSAGPRRQSRRRSIAAAARLHRHRRLRRFCRCVCDLDRAMGRRGTAGGLSASASLAQERRASAELYVQGGDYDYRYRICRGGVARLQGHAR